MFTADRDAIEQEIVRIRRRLTDLNAEQAGLEAALASLEHQLSAIDEAGRFSPFQGATVTNSSPASDKIALFRRLFAGRPDVFPVRWENRKDGSRRIFAGLLQRMGKGHLRQANGQMRRMPASGIHSSVRRDHRKAPSRRRSAIRRIYRGSVPLAFR